MKYNEDELRTWGESELIELILKLQGCSESHYREAKGTFDNYDLEFTITYALDHLELAAKKDKDKRIHQVIEIIKDYQSRPDVMETNQNNMFGEAGLSRSQVD